MWSGVSGGYVEGVLGGGMGRCGMVCGPLVISTGATEVDRLVETFSACWRPGKYAAAGCLDLQSARLSVSITQDTYYNLQ